MKFNPDIQRLKKLKEKFEKVLETCVLNHSKDTAIYYLLYDIITELIRALGIDLEQKEYLHGFIDPDDDKLKQCPCCPATKCIMEEPCLGCETYSAWERSNYPHE